MTDVNRRNALGTLAGGAAAAGAATALPRRAQGQEQVTWRMQALWDGGTTPQTFEQKFVERVAELRI